MRTRLETLEQFKEYQAIFKKAFEAEKRKVLVCCGTGCVAGGSLRIYEALKTRMAELGLKTAVELAMEPEAENVWSPAGGEPVIVTLREGAQV